MDKHPEDLGSVIIVICVHYHYFSFRKSIGSKLLLIARKLPSYILACLSPETGYDTEQCFLYSQSYRMECASCNISLLSWRL